MLLSGRFMEIRRVALAARPTIKNCWFAVLLPTPPPPQRSILSFYSLPGLMIRYLP